MFAAALESLKRKLHICILQTTYVFYVYRSYTLHNSSSDMKTITYCDAIFTRFAAQRRDGNDYFILLIITDGIITDMPQTCEAIVSVSRLYIYIRIITEMPQTCEAIVSVSRLYIYIRIITDMPQTCEAIVSVSRLYIYIRIITDMPQTCEAIVSVSWLNIYIRIITDMPQTCEAIVSVSRLYWSFYM